VTPSRRESYHHGDLKRALLATAGALLDERGPDFTLREAAAKVGVAHSAAYRHFADKRALLAALAADGFDRLDRLLERGIAAAPSPRRRLEAVLRAYVRFAFAHPAQLELMFGPRLNEDERFPELEAAVARPFGRVQALLGETLGAGSPNAVRDATVALWTMAHGFAVLALSRRVKVRSRAAAEDYVCALAAPMLDGMCGRATAREG
jgi:AcrR family transcriptional regulator